MTTPEWITETLHGAAGLRTQYAASQILHEHNTGHQHLILFENPRFGRVLMLDGAVQLTQADEFIYHEMITHVPLVAHGGVKSLAIIGGGDGGVAREALRHQKLEQVTLFEIDRGVVEFCREFLPEVSAGAFDDPRLDLVIGDGAAMVKSCEAEFDVIIVDSTDPVGPGAALFTHQFYADCAAALRPGGVLVTQNGVPFLQPAELRTTMSAFKTMFADAAAYLATVPTYVGGPMAFGWGSDDAGLRRLDLSTIESRFVKAGVTTRYYTPAVQLSAFALPRYIGETIGVS